MPQGHLTQAEATRRKQIEYLAANGPHSEVSTLAEIKRQAIAQLEEAIDKRFAHMGEGYKLVIAIQVEAIGPTGKVTRSHSAARNMPEYAEWRTAVFQRDGYQCQHCGAKSDLRAHHIKRWALYPEVRFDLDNGKTLCESCHIKEHKRMKREAQVTEVTADAQIH